MAEANSGGTSLLPPVKSVVVHRNGDPFYCGRRFVVNQRQVATMEAFLNEVTQNIGAPLAIRNLYTPRQGHRVGHFQDLHTGGHYVAAGFERFKKLDYLNTGLKKTFVAREGTQARVNQRPNVSAKWRKFIPIPCIIHVFRNGDLLCPPFRFIIPRSMQHDLEQVLRMVTEKASLRTGAVRRLCSMDGATVTMGEKLETGQCYVAVGTERFRKLPYVELWLSKVQRNKRMEKRAEMMKPATGPVERFSDFALLDSPLADGRRVKSSGDEATEAGNPPANQGRVMAEDPVRIHRDRGQPRVPVRNRPEQTNGSHYKAGRRRREEVRGAQEVPEDENTHTELPVDQRVAEVVEDEEKSHDADVQPQNNEKLINGKMMTTDGSPEHLRSSTPPQRDSSIHFQNETQLYQIYKWKSLDSTEPHLCHQRVAEVVEDEEKSHDADVQPQNNEKMMTTDGSPEHLRSSTPPQRASSIQFQNETQLYQKHPEMTNMNKVQEAEQHNGPQADLGQEQTAAIPRVSSSTSLASRSGQVEEKNRAVEGYRSRPQSPNSKESLPKFQADIMETSDAPVTKNGGPINQITT
ncbi:doublecortin domain-containing protein 2B isoform X2 [Gadus morhua]|uniref:doublecortin domain-containing protein 2B isoform X2 n=1 Tax=Gadus morhua TaxID=8049 RepID=UPI0011B771FE|nr:doublecortin domain-containing protein 2B-like isoform X2 [Gadus morhua]